MKNRIAPGAPIGPDVEEIEIVKRHFEPERFNPRNLGAFKRLKNGTMIHVKNTDMPRMRKTDAPD